MRRKLGKTGNNQRSYGSGCSRKSMTPTRQEQQAYSHMYSHVTAVGNNGRSMHPRAQKSAYTQHVQITGARHNNGLGQYECTRGLFNHCLSGQLRYGPSRYCYKFLDIMVERVEGGQVPSAGKFKCQHKSRARYDVAIGLVDGFVVEVLLAGEWVVGRSDQAVRNNIGRDLKLKEIEIIVGVHYIS